MSQSSPSNSALSKQAVALVLAQHQAQVRADFAAAQAMDKILHEVASELGYRTGLTIAQYMEAFGATASEAEQQAVKAQAAVLYPDTAKKFIGVDYAYTEHVSKVKSAQQKCDHASKHTLSSTAWRCLLCGVEGGIVVSPDGRGYEYEEKVVKTPYVKPESKVKVMAEAEDLDPPRSLRIVS